MSRQPPDSPFPPPYTEAEQPPPPPVPTGAATAADPSRPNPDPRVADPVPDVPGSAAPAVPPAPSHNSPPGNPGGYPSNPAPRIPSDRSNPDFTIPPAPGSGDTPTSHLLGATATTGARSAPDGQDEAVDANLTSPVNDDFPHTPSSNVSALTKDSSTESPSSGFRPDPAMLAAIMGAGFTQEQATAALYRTGNSSADAAVEMILMNPDLEFFAMEDLGAVAFKMVMVVNQELRMGLGKVAAQVGHGSLGLYRDLLGENAGAALAAWSEQGETKVVVKGESTSHLHELERQAGEAGLRSYLVHDAGRTQIAAGSATVLAIFGSEEEVDAITGKLKLL